MTGHGVEQVHRIPGTREREGVRAFGAANVQHHRWRRRQVAREQHARALSFQARPRPQPFTFDAMRIVSGDRRIEFHAHTPADVATMRIERNCGVGS